MFPTADTVLKSLMRQTFDLIEQHGGFRSSGASTPMPAGYAKALAAQQDENAKR